MNGPDKVLVTQYSATHCRSQENGEEHICGLGRGHSDLVKFGREDDDCRLTLRKLQGFAQRAISGKERLDNPSAKCA